MKKKLIITLFITFLTLPNISFAADDDLKELTDAVNDAQKEFNDLKTGNTSEAKIIDDAIKEIDKATKFAKEALENNNTEDAIKTLKFIEKFAVIEILKEFPLALEFVNDELKNDTDVIKIT